jgi:ATP phosphoribosyltransferase
VETLLESEAVLAGPTREFEDARAGLAAMLLRRLDGVLKLKDSKLLMFRAHRDTVAELTRLLPDADPLTLLPMEGDGPLSLQTMCHGAVTWQRLEELERAGAQSLMVLSVERSLA